MKWSSVSSASKQVRIIRPLLEVGRDELEQFARENKIRFREDASNSSRDMLRNRVRHELLPLLRKNFQPGLNRTVLRLMDVVGAEAEAVGRAAKDWLANRSGTRAWEELPVGVQRQAVQLQLQRLKIAVDFDLIEALRLRARCAVSINSRQLVLRDEAGQVTLVAPMSRAFKKAELKLNLVCQTSPVSFAGLELRWSFSKGTGVVRGGPGSATERFDAAKVGRNVVLRHWRPGDRFQPIGTKSAVKLQDWFTNQKIPAERRRELVIAATERGEIFWVEGLRIGEQFKLEHNTRKQLCWRWHRRGTGKSPALRGPRPRATLHELKHHG